MNFYKKRLLKEAYDLKLCGQSLQPNRRGTFLFRSLKAKNDLFLEIITNMQSMVQPSDREYIDKNKYISISRQYIFVFNNAIWIILGLIILFMIALMLIPDNIARMRYSFFAIIIPILLWLCIFGIYELVFMQKYWSKMFTFIQKYKNTLDVERLENKNMQLVHLNNTQQPLGVDFSEVDLDIAHHLGLCNFVDQKVGLIGKFKSFSALRQICYNLKKTYPQLNCSSMFNASASLMIILQVALTIIWFFIIISLFSHNTNRFLAAFSPRIISIVLITQIYVMLFLYIPIVLTRLLNKLSKIIKEIYYNKLYYKTITPDMLSCYPSVIVLDNIYANLLNEINSYVPNNSTDIYILISPENRYYNYISYKVNNEIYYLLDDQGVNYCVSDETLLTNLRTLLVQYQEQIIQHYYAYGLKIPQYTILHLNRNGLCFSISNG